MFSEGIHNLALISNIIMGSSNIGLFLSLDIPWWIYEYKEIYIW